MLTFKKEIYAGSITELILSDLRDLENKIRRICFYKGGLHTYICFKGNQLSFSADKISFLPNFIGKLFLQLPLQS